MTSIPATGVVARPQLARQFAFVGLLAWACLPAVGAPSEVPIDVLFRPPLITKVRLSPNGESVAGLTPDESDRTSLLLLDYEQKSSATIRGTAKYSIRSFHWLSDRYVMYSVTRSKIFVEGLFMVDRTRPAKQIAVNLDQNTAFVGAPRARPGHAIIWAPHLRESLANVRELFEIDSSNSIWFSSDSPRHYNTNVRYYAEPKDGNVLRYGRDAEGELALCEVYDQHRHWALLYNLANDIWQKLELDPEQTNILLAEPDHAHLWITEYSESEGFRLRRMDVATGQKESPVVVDRNFNPSEGEMVYSHREGKVAGIQYPQRRLRNVWLLPKFAAVQAAVDRQLPDTDNYLTNFDDNEQKFLFFASSDRYAGGYFLLDTVAHALTPVGQTRPWLKGQAFQPMLPITYLARDGLKLEGYLILPAGADSSHRVPLVVLCHGGPTARDVWSFDPEVQFLASRGYAVLQPNFRGSSGFTPAVSLAPRFDFRRMHDDVTDAAKAISHLEMIDPNRVAIMGGGFGGYLAVAGLAFEPGLYRCAVTMAGVCDWKSFIEDIRWQGLPGEYEELIDHVGTNKSAFERISPLAAADRISAPVFIAHGLDDNIVDVTQSRKLASALRHRKVPVETLYRDFELHGFFSYANRVEYYQGVEKFLAKYLRAPTPPLPASGSRPSASN